MGTPDYLRILSDPYSISRNGTQNRQPDKYRLVSLEVTSLLPSYLHPSILDIAQYSMTLRDELKHAGWIPKSRKALDQWLKKKVKEVTDNPQSLAPVIVKFQSLIESDPEIYMGFVQMFDEVPTPAPVKDYMTMLQLLNNVIAAPPEWSEDNDPPGLAINNILTSVVVTPAGFTTFCDDKVNKMLRDVLTTWKSYLGTPDSAKVLTTDPGFWLNPTAIAEFSKYLPNKDFVAAFGCDTTKVHWGYQFWDDFFARLFANIDITRPLPSPDDDSIIVSACESTAYNTASNVTEFSTFWLKGETYSLKLMLNNDELAPQFYGGSVYQAFLNVTDYHRWHSPVTGTIRKFSVVEGTYYALAPAYVDQSVSNEEITSIIEAQSYLSIVATRALIFIEADNPAIGLMCFVGVGMIEVSSCEITVKVNQPIKKGDPLGTFHFGGSTHCLVFRPETQLAWTSSVLKKQHIAIRSAIGTATAAPSA